jgi:hypothetical protein
MLMAALDLLAAAAAAAVDGEVLLLHPVPCQAGRQAGLDPAELLRHFQLLLSATAAQQ